MSKNSILDFERLANTIRVREFSPVYLLQGEESFYIDSLTELLENTVLTPEEKSFNQTILYGKEINVKDIIMASKRYPMMSEHQLIVVKEAQNIKKEHWDDFINYLEKPLKSTILVINFKAKKLDQRTKVSKLFQKYVVFNSDKLYDNQVAGWIDSYIRKKDKNIDTKAAQLVAEYLGNDLGKIVNEIDKMLIQIPKEVQLINTKHIEENIGISKDFNVFELQKAIGQKNFNKSIQIINYFASDTNKNPLILVISNLFSYFNKVILLHESKNLAPREQATRLGVNEFFLSDYKLASSNYSTEKLEHILAILKYFDLKSKGVGGNSTSEGELMREMVIRIFAD